jgi:hypothetical protein
MARDPYPSETQDRFLLRMPDGMRDRLKAEAEANKRSMNAEIVARLEFSLTKAERVRETIYHGDHPLEIADDIVDDMLVLLERARARYNEKYGETPLERRKPVAFPVRVVEPGPLPIEEYPDESLEQGLEAIQAEITRRQKAKPAEPSRPKLTGQRRPPDLNDREPGKGP